MTPNSTLRRLRISRGWTREDLAARVGFSSDTVKDWERGRTSCPHPGSLAALAATLEVGIADLGFDLGRQGTEHPGAYRNEHSGPIVAPESDSATGGTSAVFRRQFLGVSAAAVALTAVNSEGLDRAQAALLADDPAASAVDSTLLAGLASVTLGYERLRRQVSSRDLVEPVYSHLDMLDRLLRASLLPAQRTVLTANLSQVLSLMSWLHYFDKSDKAQGRRWLHKSIAAAMESGDPRLEVLGLIRAAEQSTYDQRGPRSVELLHSAHQIASAHASPRAQSWVLSAQAEAYSTFGEADQSMRLLERAQARLDLAEPQQEAAERSSWVEFWDQSRLDSYVGACYMRLEQPVKARAALTSALDRAETSAVKYRSIYLMDLATTYAQEDEVEQACSLAERAFDLAGLMHYGTTLERMQALRGRLRRWSLDGRVRQLEDKVRSAAADSRA